MDYQSSESLSQKMYQRFVSEIPLVQRITNNHWKNISSTGFDLSNTSSTEDALFLYLLIRQFQRNNAFELGTFIGTTAVAMNEAAKKNGGTFVTTDPVDHHFVPHDTGIRFIQGAAEHGLAILKREGKKIDFAFGDWLFEPPVLELANDVFTADCIIAVHDYFPDFKKDGIGNDKGEVNVQILNDSYCKNRPGRWLLPAGRPWVMRDSMTINVCTAVFIPDTVMLP